MTLLLFSPKIPVINEKNAILPVVHLVNEKFSGHGCRAPHRCAGPLRDFELGSVWGIIGSRDLHGVENLEPILVSSRPRRQYREKRLKTKEKKTR